jgi:hypothetical protein
MNDIWFGKKKAAILKLMTKAERSLFYYFYGYNQGVTKRCRLSLLTNSAIVDESQCGERGGGGGCGVSANEYSCAHHVPLSLWRSISIFNLCLQQLRLLF